MISMDEELRSASPVDAAKYIAGLSDSAALRVLVEYNRMRQFPLEEMLRMVKSYKGEAPSYADAARAELSKPTDSKSEAEPQATGQLSYSQMDSNKYPALNFVSGLNKVLGWIVVVLGVLMLIVGVISFQGIPVGAGVVFLVLGVSSVAFGELINVFVDIEANTRRGAR